MGIVYVLLPLSLLLALGGLAAFLWAARRGQFEDLDSPSVRILFDQDEETVQGNKIVGESPTAEPGSQNGGDSV